MNSKGRNTAEKYPNPPIDALLVHGYWFDYKSENLLDIHGNLQLLACSELFKEGLKNVVLLGGKIDPGQESIGLVMQRELLKKMEKSFSKRVIFIPNSKTTRQEVKNFKKLMAKNQWEYIASLSLSIHLPRVKRSFKRIFDDDYRKVRFISTEEVLNSPIFRKKLDIYRKSADYKLLKANETVAGAIDGIPFIGGCILDFMIKILPAKGAFLSRVHSFFEKESM